MKILAVGNSFSQDATALLEFLAPRLPCATSISPDVRSVITVSFRRRVRRHMSTRWEENAVYRSFSLWKKG